MLVCSNLLKISFNRYMVECKFYCIVKIITRLNVLIDTWWNVNDATVSSHELEYRF